MKKHVFTSIMNHWCLRRTPCNFGGFKARSVNMYTILKYNGTDYLHANQPYLLLDRYNDFDEFTSQTTQKYRLDAKGARKKNLYS